MRPSEIPTRETLAFLARVLPKPPLRILEVGCGRGEVAAALLARGYDVTPIDASAAAVAACAANGVPAIEARFLELEAAPFGAILFTRSLHHLHPLDRVLAHARALLEPTGLFVLEEFAVEAVDMTTALWFYDACSILEAAGILGIDKEDAARSEPDPMLRWKAEHAHDEHGEHEALHTGEAMQSAIESAFMALETTQAPYLYRTVCAGVDASSRGERAAERLLALEKDRIERGLLRAVGFRMVARP